MMTSLAESFASLMAPRTISSGLSVPAPGQRLTLIALATCASCSRAAGRYTSVETTIGRWPCCASHFASFPVVVVLPEPCKPTIIHTEGGREAKRGFGGFAGPWQADNHPHRRRPGGEEWLGMFAEQCGQLVAHDFDNLLIGRELQHDLAAERFAANSAEQFIDNGQRDVAREHGFTDFGERGVQVLFGKLALAAEILESALQLFCKVFKHGGRDL